MRKSGWGGTACISRRNWRLPSNFSTSTSPWTSRTQDTGGNNIQQTCEQRLEAKAANKGMVQHTTGQQCTAMMEPTSPRTNAKDQRHGHHEGFEFTKSVEAAHEKSRREQQATQDVLNFRTPAHHNLWSLGLLPRKISRLYSGNSGPSGSLAEIGIRNYPCEEISTGLRCATSWRFAPTSLPLP